MTIVAKRSKLEKLVATFEHFAKAIASISDARAQRLHEMASGVRAFVATVRETSPRPTPSAISAGLEQGLREIPFLITEISPEWRAQASTALNEALLSEFPEFLEQDQKRLQKVVDRGYIRTEAEFYLVRHNVDLIEGVAGKEGLLHQLYSFLDLYESKA